MGTFRDGLGLKFPQLAVLGLLASAAQGQLSVTGFGRTTVTVSSSGSWSVFVPGPGWTFSGRVGAQAIAPRVSSAKDALGLYEEIAFDYSLAGSSRTASIRIYRDRPAALFSVTWNNGGANTSSFPAFSVMPGSLSHLSFNGMFAPGDFAHLLADSPWASFDAAGNTFILSPAANFMTASTDRMPDGSVAAGISSKITVIPAGFTHRTALVFDKGINRTFETWGRALTDLAGKKRPANDKGALLKSVSYWTDNGATYYYNPGGPSYSDTLKAVKSEFDTKGIRLGSLQLDSWWYPKGPDNSWSSHSGIWTYTAAPALFHPDLTGFQTGLKTPLVTHARWIDINSPYRAQYTMSGNVATDPRYWESIAGYLKASGVTTYEQDWLGTEAHSDFNLTDADAFLGNMAASMAKQGITIQYCMAMPRHFLQTMNYSNVTTIRTSQDRFRREVWSNFFYSSRLASALGVWPFSDVFMSTERDNLIAATLSAGPVGVGDPMGEISRDNLLKSVRADGIIVKPDVAATPIDSIFQNDATGVDVPMVVSTYSDFGGGMRTHYIFAFTRGTNNTITINPEEYGITGAAYLYDSLAQSGNLIDRHSTRTLDLTDGTGYFVLAPVGPSGLAMLGDQNQFVSMGKKRIPAFSDDGAAEITVSFAAGEQTRTIFGYSPRPVAATVATGTQGSVVWDSSTQLFAVNLHPAARIASVKIAVTGNPVKTGGCGVLCGGGSPLPESGTVQ